MTTETDRGPAHRAPADAPLCVHHWVIDAADGAESRGRCKHCGEQRGFANSSQADAWAPKGERERLGSVVTVPVQRHLELADER